MTTTTIQFRNIPGTEAAMGWAGGHALVADRPAGTAGGQGLGFNGGQLLGLAIGGCMCNDLRYVAHEMGITLTSLSVDVALTFSDNPKLVTEAEMRIEVAAEDPEADIAGLLKRAKAETTIGNSLMRGLSIRYAGC